MLDRDRVAVLAVTTPPTSGRLDPDRDRGERIARHGALGGDPRADLHVGLRAGRRPELVDGRAVDRDDACRATLALDGDGRRIDGRDLSGGDRRRDHDGVDRVGAVGVAGLAEPDLVTDLEIADGDRLAALGDDGRTRHGDGPAPAVIRGQRDLRPADGSDGDGAAADGAEARAEVLVALSRLAGLRSLVRCDPLSVLGGLGLRGAGGRRGADRDRRVRRRRRTHDHEDGDRRGPDRRRSRARGGSCRPDDDAAGPPAVR